MLEARSKELGEGRWEMGRRRSRGALVGNVSLPVNGLAGRVGGIVSLPGGVISLVGAVVVLVDAIIFLLGEIYRLLAVSLPLVDSIAPPVGEMWATMRERALSVGNVLFAMGERALPMRKGGAGRARFTIILVTVFLLLVLNEAVSLELPMQASKSWRQVIKI